MTVTPTVLIPIAIGILIVLPTIYCIYKYYKDVIAPVKREQLLPLARVWEDFILLNIKSCKLIEQCNLCEEMIILFDTRFNGHIPGEIFTTMINNLLDTLDRKDLVLRENLNEELSNSSLDDPDSYRDGEILYTLFY